MASLLIGLAYESMPMVARINWVKSGEKFTNPTRSICLNELDKTL